MNEKLVFENAEKNLTFFKEINHVQKID
jgi:hypothetical protein